MGINGNIAFLSATNGGVPGGQSISFEVYEASQACHTNYSVFHAGGVRECFSVSGGETFLSTLLDWKML